MSMKGVMPNHQAYSDDSHAGITYTAGTPIRIPLSRPDITTREIEAVSEILRSPNLALGPTLAAFEQEFAQALARKHAVAVNSGTSALFLGLSALDIGPGDEVITTPFTFIASVTSILMTGATPVLVDIDASSLNLDPNLIAAQITPRTRAILPVEVFGNPLHMDTILEIAHQHHLSVIEDSCEALGSALHGRLAGTFGTVSTFAFYPNKQITTGEGGILLTDDPNLADLCTSLRNQGRCSGHHWLQHDRLGYNYRMSDINAALGRVQLSRLAEFIERRAQVAHWYLERLTHEPRVIPPHIATGVDMSWFVFVIRLSESHGRVERDHIMQYLASQGIQTSNYFPPVHLQPFMAKQFGYRPGDFPITESISERTIALPFYNHLHEDQVDFICSQLTEALNSLSAA